MNDGSMGIVGEGIGAQFAQWGGTWFGYGRCKDAIELCDKTQNFFWRVVLSVPESCPKLALRCETGMIGMKWRIWEAKLNLLLRIKNHNTSVLCRQVYEEGRRNGWPGLSMMKDSKAKIFNKLN